jgi:hypothetical protein
MRLEQSRSWAGPPACAAPTEGDASPTESLGTESSPGEPPVPRLETARLASLVQGARLRVTTSAGREVGALVAADVAGLTLSRDDGAPVRIPQAAIRRVEASLGPALPGDRARWASYGAVVGFVVTIVSRVLSNSGHGDSEFGAEVLGGLLIGVPAGAAMGYAAAPRERWVAARPPTTVPAARRDSLGVAIAVRF